MSYPVINRQAAQDLVDSLLTARQDGLDVLAEMIAEAEHGVVLRDGGDYDRHAVETCSAKLRAEHADGLNATQIQDAFKGREASSDLESSMAGPIHEVLSTLDLSILQDGDFWRYLALFPFRWYLVARKPKLAPVDFGGRTAKRDDEGQIVGYRASSLRSQLLMTTYLWGACAHDESPGGTGWDDAYARATALDPKTISVVDFWHSHMIRVKVGHMGEVPKAMVDVTRERELSTSEARKLQKLLTRMKNTVVFDLYDYASARQLVEGQADMIDAVDLSDDETEEYVDPNWA
jgi:hypothetical protein